MSFVCNVCGAPAQAYLPDMGRETPSCAGCGSTTRMRGMVHALTLELFGKSLAIKDIPVHPEIRGVGLSDWDGYAVRLAHRLGYKNTFYHQEPRLDITEIDPAMEGTLDFIMATDVFEHVAPPVSRAFTNARRLLKPSGVFVFSVPYTLEERTKEHFPDLHQFSIEERSGRFVMTNQTRDGRSQVFEDLVFHGGGGSTLEMRVFSEASLREEFRRAGFGPVRVHRDAFFEHGIYWPQPWSLPMTARAL